MNYEQVQKLNPADFKRYCGLHQETLDLLRKSQAISNLVFKESS